MLRCLYAGHIFTEHKGTKDLNHKVGLVSNKILFPFALVLFFITHGLTKELYFLHFSDLNAKDVLLLA